MPRHRPTDTSAAPGPEDLYRLLSAVQHVFRRAIDERLGVFGMSAVQCRALQLISERPGLPQRHLAELMGQSAQGFGTLLARLVASGYLVRRRGRGHTATHELTGLGRIMLQQSQEIAHDVQAFLFMPLSGEERQSLQASLQKVLNARWRLRFHPLPESS